eukprot:TRINITY_DN20251_c0_g1_i2.p1 TRINITY_DN20251_c0_g1~~TRINITY_DN20251_c0_g1_i2.p1  ORF type:complete len:536 (-),score=114.20 TRINITY_DN20251_c0_g1_i2:31-1638(-)
MEERMVMGVPQGLNACIEEERAKRETWLRDTERKVCIVGSGLSGVEAAKIMIKGGLDVVLIEKGGWSGGIWLSAGNRESTAQVDPISFRPIEDDSPLREMQQEDPFDTIAVTRGDVLSSLEQDVIRLKNRILYYLELVSFQRTQNNLLKTKLRDTVSGEEFECDFGQLHIRTGGLDRPRIVTFPNEDKFSGRIVSGVGNDIQIEQFYNKVVVVVGFGAFAIENVRRAMMGGAKKIILLPRKWNKPLFPEYATFLLKTGLQDLDDREEEQLRGLWRRVYDVLNAVGSLCHIKEVSVNPNTVRMVDGEPAIIFDGGVPPLSCNSLYLACAYGLCQIKRGEVSQFTSTGVQLFSGELIDCDIVVKCFGFTCNADFLKEHIVQDSWFIDGSPNVTHNIRGDRVNGIGLIGATCKYHHFLTSYYEDAQDYERCILHFNTHPKTFEAFKSLSPSHNVMDITMVDYFTALESSYKLASLEDPQIKEILNENKLARKRLYSILPEHVFLEKDKRAWDKLSYYLSSKTGNTFIPYPFACISDPK